MLIAAIIIAILVLIFVYDITQKRHAIVRNFPLVGHFRYIFEAIGPELRQYIVTNNNEERPFSRDQRRWVYASSKKQNNYFGFGTDQNVEQAPNYLIVKHAAFPLCAKTKLDSDYDPYYKIPCAKTIGAHRDRKHKFRPGSVINISGMSFGSLSANATKAMNAGAKIAGCFHNTGEGGISPHHKQGGDLVFQIGTASFGCREKDGRFSISKLKDLAAENPIKAIEIKLSQGAKPGLGGMLPAAKINREIAETRGIPEGVDCISPSSNSEFSDVDSLLDFVEMVASETGLPVGIKSAIGEEKFWIDLTTQMSNTDRGVDYIAVDGGEGGTGAAPLVFSDHVGMPFKQGFSLVYSTFVKAGLQNKVVFMGAGKLGLPDTALLAMSLGCDLVSVAREAMLAIGCIQAQKCHSDHCPTGVATQSKWLGRGLDPASKADRLGNYIITLRKELLQLTHSCGVLHPGFVRPDVLEFANTKFGRQSATDLFGYEPGWGVPDRQCFGEIYQQMASKVQNPPPL